MLANALHWLRSRAHRGSVLARRAATYSVGDPGPTTMSRNLIEMLRAREGEGRRHGARRAQGGDGRARRDHRRRPPPRRRGLGLPEATVYGISTFYDDLLSRAAAATSASAPARPAGRGLRRRTCARWRRASASASASAPPTARSRSARPSAWASATARAAVRDGDVVDAGDGARRARGSRSAPRAPEPGGTSMLDEPVLLRPGDWSGLERALAALTPEELLGPGQGGQPARPRRRRLPRGGQVGVRGARRPAPTRRSWSTATRATRAPTSTSS